MITMEQLDADRAAIEVAQKKLTDDQAAYDLALPHLSVLQEIENYAIHLEANVVDEFKSLIEKAKALL